MEPQWIKSLLGTRLSDRSRGQYVLALEYAANWYRLCHDGEPFPLARVPACPMDDTAIAGFVEDQLPVIRDGHVVSSMNPEVHRALQYLGYFQGHPCPSEATTRWRLKVMHACQNRLHPGYYSGKLAFRQGEARVSAEWQRVNAALGSHKIAASGRDFVHQLRGVCTETPDGIRNRALVTLMQLLTTGQLARLRLGDLNLGNIQVGEALVPVVEITIDHPANQFQRNYPHRRLFGPDAEAVTLWWTHRVQDDLGMRDDALSQGLPFFVRYTRAGRTATVSREWVLKTFHRLARASSLEVAGGICRPSMIRSLGDWESAEYGRLVVIADQLGLERVESVYRILKGSLWKRVVP
jgi:hypothetical protein